MDKKSKEKYVFVKFPKSNYEYIYKTDIDLEVGNIVEAPTGNYTDASEAIVTKVENLSEKELPIAKQRILKITKLISKMDERGNFDVFNFIVHYPKFEFLEEWKLEMKDDWVTVWGSSFNYKISYEKDGVLEVFYIPQNFEYYFGRNTITSPKHLKQKIAYVQTITSQFYHKIIDLKTFDELFDKLPLVH